VNLTVCVKLEWDISSFENLMCSDLSPIYDINDKKISNLTPSKFPRSSYAVFGRFSRPNLTLTHFNFSQEGNIQMSWNFSCFMTSCVLSEKLWKNFFRHFLDFLFEKIDYFSQSKEIDYQNSISFYFMTLKHIKKLILFDLWPI